MKIKRSLATLLGACVTVAVASISVCPVFAFAVGSGAPAMPTDQSTFPYQTAFYIAAALAVVAVCAWVLTFVHSWRTRHLICRDQRCAFNASGSSSGETYDFRDFSDHSTLPADRIPTVDPGASMPAPSLTPASEPAPMPALAPIPAPTAMDTGMRRAVREDAVQHAVYALQLEVETATQAEICAAPEIEWQPLEPVVPIFQAREAVLTPQITETAVTNASMDFTDDMIQEVLSVLRGEVASAPMSAPAPAPAPVPIASAPAPITPTPAPITPTPSASAPTPAPIPAEPVPESWQSYAEPAKVIAFRTQEETPKRRGSHFREEADAWVAPELEQSEETGELFDLVQQLMQHAQEDIAQRTTARRAS